MLFNTWEFWFFFFLLALALGASVKRHHNTILLIASFVFYGAWDIRFCALMASTIVIDYFVAQLVSPETNRPRTARRRILTLSIGLNLCVLGMFKYFDFFVESLGQLIPTLDTSSAVLGLVLPVGISFYTFQSISYTVDVYRGHLAPARSLRDYALFVSLFPQLVAGPIERATHLLPQVESERRVTFAHFGEGAHLIALGLFKKVVVADTLAHPVNAVFAHPSPTAWEVYVAVIAFALQIYGDFSGYTDIARGIAKWLGFDLMINFNLPYLAKNPADFWKRWHISLSTWLRDYLYIPLGGNRGGPARMYRNLVITMLLGGLWHGARWNFVLWGLFHGLGLVIHRRFANAFGAAREDGTLGSVIKVVAMLHFTLFGWLLFRVENMDQLGRMLGPLLRSSWERGTAVEIVTYGAPVVLPLLLLEWWHWRTGGTPVSEKVAWPLRTAVVSLCVASAVLLNRGGGSPFIYFQF
ncbi:MAG TPA: MBOAT family protein [Polyangiaceae bacterium]